MSNEADEAVQAAIRRYAGEHPGLFHAVATAHGFELADPKARELAEMQMAAELRELDDDGSDWVVDPDSADDDLDRLL